MNLLILGAGGHGRVVREMAEAAGQYEEIVFLDDGTNQEGVIGKLSDYDKFAGRFAHAFVAIGNPAVRKKYKELLLNKYDVPVLIHPEAYISRSCSIGEGTVVMAGAIIQPNSRIGAGCIISVGAIVDHDSVVGDYCHINAGAIVPSMSNVPTMTKVDYGAVYHGAPDSEWADEYKRQFGKEPSFF